MPRVIHRGTGEVVHCRIDDDKGVAGARLDPQHARQKDAGFGRDEAPGLEEQCRVPIARHLGDHCAIGFGIGAGLAGAIGDAQPTAEIDMIDAVALLAQRADEAADLAIGGLERRKVDDLAADMNRKPVEIEPGKRREPIVHAQRLIDRDAELAVEPAGGDLGMRAGIDVGVDAQQGRGAAAALRRERRQQLSFALEFEVETPDPGIERRDQFGRGLADARIDDVVRRNPGVERAI